VVADANYHPYTGETKLHIQSVTKSVIGMLVGKAISDGYIKSENEKLVEFYQGRIFENPSKEKSSIKLKHLLSMSSGLDCAAFDSSRPSMEQSQGWVQYMLDLPVIDTPGTTFGYCNGNAHLLSSVIEKTTGMTAREYANQGLFEPLGIAPVTKDDWWGDPQKITTAGYGLHLKPLDMAKLALLYLNNGQWDGQQIVPSKWVAASTTQHIQKEDGSGYGYLWTVYPEARHYAALGMGGQQIHIYPQKNLIVVITATLESYAEAPEIEKMLNDYILPAVESDSPLAKDSTSYVRLEAAIEKAANPVQPIAKLPSAAFDNSNHPYTFGENALGWQTMEFRFEPNSATAHVLLNELPLQVGLDNIYRTSETAPGYEMLLRGRWTDESTLVIDYPYAFNTPTILGELGESQFRFTFAGNKVRVTAEQLVFGGEPISVEGSR
jgi:CubicO group peptidase (beta-lactamase class C family)